MAKYQAEKPAYTMQQLILTAEGWDVIQKI